MNKRVRIIKETDDKYASPMPKEIIGREFDVLKEENNGIIIDYPNPDHPEHNFFVLNDEFEWVEEESQHEPDMIFDKQDKVAPHESKLSLDEESGNREQAEDTVVESSNSLKKHGYMPIVNEVSYYEVSTFDASYIIHEHLETIVGYDISGVWFDEDSKTFRAIKKKV